MMSGVHACLTIQEQRIRASNDMKQLGKRFKEQRLKVTDRVKKRVAGVTVLPRRITVTASQFTEAVSERPVRFRTDLFRSGFIAPLMLAA